MTSSHAKYKSLLGMHQRRRYCAMLPRIFSAPYMYLLQLTNLYMSDMSSAKAAAILPLPQWVEQWESLPFTDILQVNALITSHIRAMLHFTPAQILGMVMPPLRSHGSLGPYGLMQLFNKTCRYPGLLLALVTYQFACEHGSYEHNPRSICFSRMVLTWHHRVMAILDFLHPHYPNEITILTLIVSHKRHIMACRVSVRLLTEMAKWQH